MKQQKTVTLFTYIHAVDELIRKSRSSQQVVAAHPSDWAAADLFFLSSGMWMRPKNKRMMTKRIPPPQPPDFVQKISKKKKEFQLSPRDIARPSKTIYNNRAEYIQQWICIVERAARFISNSVPLRQRYIEILPRSSYYASRWEWHTNETRFWRCKRPTPSLHAQQQKSEISIFFPPFKQEIIR